MPSGAAGGQARRGAAACSPRAECCVSQGCLFPSAAVAQGLTWPEWGSEAEFPLSGALVQEGWGPAQG